MWLWILATAMASDIIATTAFEDGSKAPLVVRSHCRNGRVRTLLQWVGDKPPPAGRPLNLAVFVGHGRSEVSVRFTREHVAPVHDTLREAILREDPVGLQLIGFAHTATLEPGDRRASLDGITRECGYTRLNGFEVVDGWEGDPPWLAPVWLTWTAREPPRYPPRARGTQEGVVVCHGSLTLSPKPSDITVTDCPEVFSKEAHKTLKRWRIEPVKTESGEVATVRTDVFLRFREPSR